MKSRHFKLKSKLEELSSGKMKKVYGGTVTQSSSPFFDDCNCNSVVGCGDVKKKETLS